jgi:DNA-binding SARP family transcriptional activator
MKNERAKLCVWLLGPFQVTVAGEVVTGFATDKGRALLAYLMVERDRPHRREALAGLLWPDYPEEAARASLRVALANVRQVIGDRDAPEKGYLEVSRQTIQFNGESDTWSDVATFEASVETATAADESGDPSAIERLEQAVALYRGDFLEGFTVADSEPFEHWALLTREGLERRALRALGRLVNQYEASGELGRALELAWRQVEMDPWRETAQCRLLRLLARAGQRGAAVAQYEAYCERLRELEGRPSEQMQGLYEQLLEGEVPAIPASGVKMVGRAPRQVGPCPYRGLAAFREADAAFFFGREGFIERLHEAVHHRPLVAVILYVLISVTQLCSGI